MASAGGLSAAGRSGLVRVFASGKRVTTTADAAAALGSSTAEAARTLAEWASRGWVRRARRGLYLAVPVDARDPAAWTVDPWFLADIIWDPCYITGWTAANHWSLTDQIFRTTVVATTGRVRRVAQRAAGHEYLVHHVAAGLLGWGLRTEWREQRKVRVADPARTVMELLGDPALGGGIRHVAEIVENYLDVNDPASLIDAGSRLGNGAAFKRLGYLLEESKGAFPELVEACRERITAGLSELDPAQRDSGPLITRWNLRANVDLSGAP